MGGLEGETEGWERHKIKKNFKKHDPFLRKTGHQQVKLMT